MVTKCQVQELYIRRDAFCIHRKYADRDLAHDAHGIWQLAGDCLRSLTIKYDGHPLAGKLAINMVDCYSSLWNEAHRSA